MTTAPLAGGAAAPAGTLPVAFFGHGSPLNTLAVNRYTTAWKAFGRSIAPRAVVVVSAHWYGAGTRVTASPHPRTIHDFNARFPRALFDFQYPVRSDAALADRIVELLAPVAVIRDTDDWGIDHGAYSVLAHVFPEANVPFVGLSIDRTKPPAYHYALAQRLAPLRDEGVFIMSSGNIVHNLELRDLRPDAPPYDWARRFDELVCTLMLAGDHAALTAYRRLGDDARLAIPTPDHYLPFLYALALQRTGEHVRTIVDGFEFPAGSMRSLSIA